MWLMNTKTYKLENFVNPPSSYSILSHTWEGDEVFFQDMESLPYARSKAGWKKIQMTCEASRQANFSYTWIDTCCIDKRSSAELSEAINSMFAWYQHSSVCYVYLSDLVFPCSPVDTVMPKSDEGRQWADVAFSKLEDELRACRWFTRGWTLQELIAPSQVVFLDQNWNRIGSRTLGSDLRFIKTLERLTGIPSTVLDYKSDIATIPVAQRMSWAACRETTRVEDIAYCLLGIFNVNMPLLYGEGSKSFLRLQEEIVKSHDDLSLFAWKQDSASYGIGLLRGCFADSPAEFAHWLNIQISVNNFESGMEVTSKNVKMDGRVLRKEDHPAGTAHGVECIFDLSVRDPDDENYSLGILLAGSSRSLTHFRFKPYELIKLPPRKALLCRDDFDSGAEFDVMCWEQEEAREESERKTIFIRKSISVQETRMMGHLQKPLFKIHWHGDVLKVLKSVNGQTTKEYIPSFECHPDSAFHQDGTLTWVTDFELQINPQHVVSFVLATGLQWAPEDLGATCFRRAELHYPHFWAVLFGEGRAYAISNRGEFDNQSTGLRVDGEGGDNSAIVSYIKRMDHRERGTYVRERLLKHHGGDTGLIYDRYGGRLARLVRIFSPLDRALPTCDVWMESRNCEFDDYGELEIRIGPCHELGW
ncbi:het domain protein [Fusarium subglutinans]|uniref:Het domain protein n=1 Tax=Gibberella subglutinans TaxID=42677 RepID=A0A8H5L814_GIBSU|nr:het domain protein [Fusarium subglutinans]KAF5586398.1 het domain protein [Fusarium subglutinans]